jgi:hypothetical protein
MYAAWYALNALASRTRTLSRVRRGTARVRHLSRSLAVPILEGCFCRSGWPVGRRGRVRPISVDSPCTSRCRCGPSCLGSLIQTGRRSGEMWCASGAWTRAPPATRSKPASGKLLGVMVWCLTLPSWMRCSRILIFKLLGGLPAELFVWIFPSRPPFALRLGDVACILALLYFCQLGSKA